MGALDLNDAESEARRQKITAKQGDRIRETLEKVCPVDATALVDGVCKVCGRQIKPSGPDTSKLSEQEAKQVAFWTRRLKSEKAADHVRALAEIRKIDPEFTPSDTPKSLKESVDKFFTTSRSVGPNGEVIEIRRLVEMG